MFVGGNFKNFSEAWKKLNDQTVLNWISQGIKLEFNSPPDPFVNKQRLLTDSEIKFVDSEIKDLLVSGCIIERKVPPAFLSQIFTVPKPNGKLRLVIDLRNINKHIKVRKFAYEDINTVLEVIKPKDKLVTIDIKNSFFHIPIHQDYSKYISFQWRGRFYSWVVLPFGLSSSPYYWSKCNRCVVRYLRQEQKVSTVCYVDDYIVNKEPESIQASRDIVVSVLKSLGFFINFEKSSLEPESQKKYIGYIIDTEKVPDAVFICIPKERVKKLKRELRKVLHNGFVSARNLARITGQCISMSKAVLPAKLLLRNLYRLLKTKNSWSDQLPLDVASRQDLEWWLGSLTAWNGQFFHNTAETKVQVTCDASKTGYGGTILHQNIEAQGYWDFSMEHRSSNYRELLAVLMTLKSFLPYLRNKAVQFLSDNITTCAAINFQGTSVRELDILAREIFATSIRNSIKIQARYLPGIQNYQSDALSRISPKYEWMLHPRLFSFLEDLHGQFSVDRFASVLTHQCARYNSRFWDPYTEAVDALQQDWADENNFVNPPFRMLSKVVDHIQKTKATATVIAPFWPAQTWFQKLNQMSVLPALRLPNPKFSCIPVQNCIPEPLKNRKWRLYAWKVCGKTI